MQDKPRDVLSPLPASDARVGGRLGDLIAAVTEARYLGRTAEEDILREAVDAFRNRVDDRLQPGRGLWQGEFWGKWVLGAVSACRTTRSDRLRGLIARAVRDVIATQDDDGYIGTYSDSTFGQCDERIFEWNIWCRKYTLWGLIEAYELLGDDAILTAARRLMDHLAGQVGPGRFDIIRTGWKEGVPSTSLLVPVVHLYRHTDEQRYLDYAHYIIDQWSAREGQPPEIFRKGLVGEPVASWFPEPKTWAKAYELLSCVEGMVELYRITDDMDLLTAARNIFASIRETDRHITGGLGNNDTLEYSRFLVQAPAEVCDAVHWVRLAVELIRLSGEAFYADEIERTLYNTLFAATGLDPAWGVRRLLLYGAHYIAPRHCFLKTHHCCVANLPRGLFQTAQIAVMRGQRGPTVLLYVPGTYRTALRSGQDVTITIDTAYPREGSIRLSIGVAAPLEFELHLRVPSWSRRTSLRLNGTACPAEARDGYICLARTWADGDRVDLDLDVTGRVTPLPAPPGCSPQPFVAVERGPLVLARDIRLGDGGSIHDPVRLETDESGRIEVEPRPAPDDVWLAFEAPARRPGGAAAPLALCDYSSAGNTWDVSTSDFRVWLPVDRRDPGTGA